MSRNRIYAWIKAECCVTRDAVRPGSTVGRNEEPVSRHGDWRPWLHGKRETLTIIERGCADASRHYTYQCAVMVAELLDWNQSLTEAQ
jgi:hypothetical protein